MSVSISPDSESPDAPAQARGSGAAPADLIVSIIGHTALLAVGFVVGMVGGLAAGWLSWLWAAGTSEQVAASVAAAVVLILLFAGCRAAGWGMGSRLGAVLPAVGWTLAAFAYLGFTTGGSIVLTATAVDYVYLYGGLAALALAVVLTPPRS
ncbi:hypothetical protein CDO52_07610 [Nocardiopsis gilva YIM 90087]|uniref:Uncharacterized protein n=1 Tax=Nocardiopsis gilva YIM 90087 TaxID=1235441 RepID=A0A223S3H6_9ACTN|nr:hypothetical protein [Nocardiopsis gilva]ASU82671.1 hypothetical protein CDO52_07610 [Nocardiopsis gilva YIM 90087]